MVACLMVDLAALQLLDGTRVQQLFQFTLLQVAHIRCDGHRQQRSCGGFWR